MNVGEIEEANMIHSIYVYMIHIVIHSNKKFLYYTI